MGISEFQYQQLLIRLENARDVAFGPRRADDAPESKLHEQIEDHCRSKGWLAVHSRLDRPTTTATGVADFLILADHGTLLVVECKRRGGKPTPTQRAFAAHCRKLGHRYALVYDYFQYLSFVSDPSHPCNRKASPSPVDSAEPPSK